MKKHIVEAQWFAMLAAATFWAVFGFWIWSIW